MRWLNFNVNTASTTGAELTVAGLRAYVAWRHRTGASSRSLQRGLSAVRTFYRYLLANGEVSHDPAQGVQAPKTKRKLPKVLDADQTARLLATDANDPLSVRDRAIFELMYSSGLRVAELVGLDKAALDLTQGQVLVVGKGKQTAHCAGWENGRHRATPMVANARRAGATDGSSRVCRAYR